MIKSISILKNNEMKNDDYHDYKVFGMVELSFDYQYNDLMFDKQRHQEKLSD